MVATALPTRRRRPGVARTHAYSMRLPRTYLHSAGPVVGGRGKSLPSLREGFGFEFTCPVGLYTRLHVTSSIRTGGRPVSCVQLSEGGF